MDSMHIEYFVSGADLSSAGTALNTQSWTLLSRTLHSRGGKATSKEMRKEKKEKKKLKKKKITGHEMVMRALERKVG